MFPLVTSREDPSIRPKQPKWQDRLNVKSNIPEYSPLKDKHTVSYRKLLGVHGSKQKQQLAGSRTQLNNKKTYFEKKVQLFERLKSVHPVYVTHLQQFEDFLTGTKLPNFWVYYSVLPLVDEIDVNGFIIRVRKAIKEQTSSYHRISAAIKAREKCLDKLRQSLSKLTSESIEKEEEKKFLRQNINDYRSLTVNAVEEIKRWRDSINLKQQRAIFYSQQNENYLIKMLNDNQFVFRSILSEYINFGQKNDPFIIVPLKKSLGKQSSQFIQIVQTDKNLAYYHKYMQYLATEKAYHMNVNSTTKEQRNKQLKYPEIQKIYTKSKSSAKFQSNKKLADNQDGPQQDSKQRQRLREQRLRKNQQRINAIKSVYESYSSKMKLKEIKKQPKKAQTDVQQKNKRQKYYSATKSNTKKPVIEDNQFQNMVKNKLEKQKKKKLFDEQKPLTARSLTKLPKTEDKMIENLKQIQLTLKNKLSFINEQTRKQQSSTNGLAKTMNIPPQSQRGVRSNQLLISQLKSQIIRNLQLESQQRQAQRLKRRQQQEKAIEQIKAKMKKEMQEKMEQKKKQKLLQREQLENKLKEQQERLNKQRQLQVQLQLKLAKEKELREVEKIKRQALQKEMKYKEQLQREQRLRRQKQQAIQKQRLQKQRLLQELKKKQLKQQLEKQIKEQIKSKYGQNQKLHPQEEITHLRTTKHLELQKEIQLIKMTETQQLQHIKKENELRARTLKLKQQQEQLKQKQLQQLIKTISIDQKQQLQKQTLKKRLQLEEQIKNAAKQKLLQQLKNQQSLLNAKQQPSTQKQQKEQIQKQKLLQQQIYRDQIKSKIQKQLRIQAIQKTQQDLEQREHQKYQINAKLENQKLKFNQIINSDINRNLIEQQVKKQLISQLIFDKQAQTQKAKNDLRLQFQKQLMGSSQPNTSQISPSQQLSIVKKNIQRLKDENFLDKKMQQLASTQNFIKPTNQRPFENVDQSLLGSTVNDQPKKVTQNKSIMNSITNQQKQMYEKKRTKIQQLRSQPNFKLSQKSNNKQEQNQGYQLLKIQKKHKQSQQESIIPRKSSLKKTQNLTRQYSKKKKPSKIQQKDSEDQQQDQRRSKKKAFQSPRKKKYHSESQDSQDYLYLSSKRKPSYKKRVDSDEPLSSQNELRYQKSRKSSIIQKSTKKQNQQNDNLQRRSSFTRNQTLKKNQNPQKIYESNLRRNTPNDLRQTERVYFDAQNKGSQLIAQQSFKTNPQRSFKAVAESRYVIKLEAIPEGELDEYLGNHFSQLPEIQQSIQAIDRESLFRKLINELTFCLLVGYENNILVGLALAFHDRSKTDRRNFTIVHFSTYHNEDLKQFLLSCVNYIFKKDPTDEIEFYFRFNQSSEEQLKFSNQWNKWFDSYGNVYQKRIQDNLYQRKYLTKRQFNQKCQVVLQGVNKNSFRNIFSVYCGLIMSDTDMLLSKQQIKDIIAPQMQISYAVAMAQMFRTYLTVEQAEILKSKVKEFAKLKQLLVLVVMLQKKKLKLQDLKLSQYKSVIQLNMRLMSQGKQPIRFLKDPGIQLNRIFYAQLYQAFNLPFNFQTTSLPIEASQKTHHISYFRLSPLPPNKLHIIKSSLYNSEMHLIPTQNSKYKLFLINGQQFTQMKDSMKMDLFMYIRLFLKNVKSHNVAQWKYVWLPQITDKANYNVREFKSFLQKDVYCYDNINISYKQFLPNALIIEPQHRDLVITPPFIVGVMSMALEQVTQGSPLYARLIDLPALRTLELEQIQIQ